MDANYRNDIEFTGSSLTVSDGPVIPTPSKVATSPGPAEGLSADSDTGGHTAGASTMVTNVISAAPVPPGKVKGKGKGKGKAMATVVGTGFTEK